MQIFIVALARAAKSLQELTLLVDNTSGDKTVSIIQTNRFIQAVKGENLQK